MDHDRQEGEAIGPQEYTSIRMEIREWAPAAQTALGDKLGGRKVFLVAATLRPETMCVALRIVPAGCSQHASGTARRTVS
jgi:hypothetical protein